MAYLKFALVVFCLLSQSAYAGYAQLRPPAGWSAGTGAASLGQAGTFSFGAAANGATYVGGTVVTNAALNVAGQVVTMPVSMRLAANAAVVAAEYSFGNPWLFAAAIAAPVLYNFYKNHGLEVHDGVWATKGESQSCTGGVCYEYSHDGRVWGSKGSAIGAGLALRNNSNPANVWTQIGFTEPLTVDVKREYTYSVNAPPEVSYTAFDIIRRVVPTAPSDIWLPVSKPDFHRTVDPLAIPPGMPEALPGVGWPTEPPVFNPDPAVAPQPSPSPAATPRPLIIPTGLPVPTPDPAVWNQPGVRVSPAPSADAPWRVDVAPVDVPQPDGAPRTGAQLNPSTPAPSTPKPDTPPGLCDLYPDILACVKLDDGTDTQLDTKDKQISITPDSGWGSGGGSCPAPRRLSHGAEFSFQPLCDFATGVSPVLVAVAWVSAALLLLGAKGGTE